MKYRAEVEAMQWRLGLRETTTQQQGEQIVAWVNENGGEARYEPERVVVSANYRNLPEGIPTRIAVRRADGWAYAEPGHYVVLNPGRVVEYRVHEDSGLDLPVFDPPPSFSVVADLSQVTGVWKPCV